jgi:uncharacterized protein (DUF2164 family)
MDIKLTRDTEQKLIASIQRYLKEEHGEDIGELKASLFLKFCLKEIGPSIYNAAVADARTFMQEKVADMENTCFAQEFSYWKDSSRRSRR